MSADLRFYLHLLLRRLPAMTVVFLALAGTGALLALRLPPVYSAEATLLIERAQIPDDLAASTVRMEPADQIELLEQHLTSRATLIDLALDHAVFAGSDGQTEAELVEAMRARTAIAPISGGGRTMQSSVTFEADDPHIAADIANALAELLVAENQRLRAGRASATETFFQDEAERLAAALEEQRTAILAFRRDNTDALPETLDYRLARQSQLQDQIAAAAEAQQALAEERLRVAHVYKATGQLGIADPDLLTPEQRQLIDLQKELDAALAAGPDDNPRILVLRTRVDQLETVVKGQIGSEEAAAGLSPLDIELARLDGESVALDQRVAAAEAELAQLDRQIGQTPATAIRLQTLERDQETLQLQYDEAVAGLAKARTGERIEELARGQRIAIIERALPPDTPARPNRRALAGGGVALGLAAAVGLFVLLELLNSSIRRPKELTTGLGIAPFAVLPHLETLRDRRRRRARGWSATGAAIAALAALAWASGGGPLPFEAVAGQLGAALGDLTGG